MLAPALARLVLSLTRPDDLVDLVDLVDLGILYAPQHRYTWLPAEFVTEALLTPGWESFARHHALDAEQFDLAVATIHRGLPDGLSALAMSATTRDQVRTLLACATDQLYPFEWEGVVAVEVDEAVVIGRGGALAGVVGGHTSDVPE